MSAPTNDVIDVTADDYSLAHKLSEEAHANGNDIVATIKSHEAHTGEDFADTFARLAGVVAAEIRSGRLTPRQ